jgi:hypothetical protein
MRIFTRIAALIIVALSFISCTASAGLAQGPCSLFCCFFGHRCGSSCEPGCGYEPSCGCGVACGMDGRQLAGQTWSGCCEDGPRLCYCRDACGNCAGGACGPANSCGCGCEPTCATEPSCGCASNCGSSNGGCGLFDCLFGCTGCRSEFYWSEWHNDPPRCCDPCDCNGNWIGPSAGYRAPYAHAYSPGMSTPMPYYANQAPMQMNQRATPQPAYARPQQPIQAKPNNYGASVYASNTPIASRQTQTAQPTQQPTQRYSANRTTRTAPPTPPLPIAQRPGTTGTRPIYR